MSNTKTNATKTNAKIDTVLSFTDLKNHCENIMFSHKKMVNTISSDAKSQQYYGFGDFSINLKSKWYAVYMSEKNRDLCVEVAPQLEKQVEINSGDTTKQNLRSWCIKFQPTQFELLSKCFETVLLSK